MDEKKEAKKPVVGGKKIGLGGLKKPEPPKEAPGAAEEAPDISKTGNYFTDGDYAKD